MLEIVTDLSIFVSSILIYKELGWELQILYNIQNNNALMYLCDLIPPTTTTAVYPMRNGSDIIIILQAIDYLYWFIPLTIREWNSLNPSLRNMEL